jgi:CelD/BcsL family acetyltransferase involved in cellulose biosynthesis
VRAELIAATALSERDTARWRELAARALEPNPFFEPEYVLPLHRGLGGGEGLQLLVVREGEDWLACMPAQLAGRWHRVPMRALTTWRGHVLYGLLGTPLLAPERAPEAVAALLEALPAAAPRASFGAIEWLASEGPVAAAIAAALDGRAPAPVPFERFERAALHRRPEQDYLEQTLSSKHRRELRRQWRKLAEALGEELTTVDLAGEESAYEAFVALEAAGELGERGTVLAADPGHAAFFAEVCRNFAAQGRLQLLALQAGEKTLAMKCNLRAGSTIFMFKIAYDESWSRFSPGILLELEMVKLFHEQTDAALLDSCADPNNAMINRLWPDRRTLTTTLLPAAGLKGRAVRPMLTSARKLRDRKSERKNAR